ncbi:hypothetical protein N9F18_00435 [bacterium]|nr:hypothetical protein [bacterium]
MAESINNVIYKIEVDTKTGQVNIDGLTKGFIQADKAVLKLQSDLAKGAKAGGKSLKGLGDATGSATSATMELSRVISDAPYGIRGMANNITQLVSQMGTATTKAGGFGAALKLMGKQLMGPLGLVFAITAAVSALDYFYGANKKAEQGTNDFRKEVEELNTTLSKQSDHTKLASESIEEYLEILIKRKKIEEQLEDLADKKEPLEEGVKNLKKALATFKDKLAADKENVFLQEKVIELGKLIESEQLKINNVYSDGQKIIDDYNSSKDDLTKAQEGTVKALELEKSAFQKLQKEVADSPAIWKTYEAAIQSVQDKIDAITGGKKNKGKKDKVEYFDIEGIAEGRGKILAEIMKTEEKIALLSAESKKDRLIIQRDFHLRRIMAIDGENSELIQKHKEYYAKLIKIEEDSELSKVRIDSFAPRDIEADAEKIKERQRLLTEVKLEALAESAQAVTGFLNGEFQREIDIEKNKTNALNNELNKRLLNENLSKEERKNIQLQIGANDEKLRIKQEQIEKKRFKLSKAANIAQATIATYLAAAQVMANPLNLNPVTKGIAMASTIAMGLANVATIARQKFQSSAGSGGQIGGGFGGGSGGGNDRDFNFNLAGTSQQNQLAQTLQGQFSQPLQAYVVGRDITNQQQLDQEILSNSTF